MTGTVSIDTAFAFASEQSPNHSSEEGGYLQDEQFLLLDDFEGSLDNQDDGPNGADSLSGPAPKRKSRRPPSTAERRATHNAVERARRESLNGRFIDLAQALPSMANVKRPSKSIIVNKSLEFVNNAVARERMLLNENDALRAEVNDLRARLGMPSLANTPKTVLSKSMVPVPIQTQAATVTESQRRRQPSIASTASGDSPAFPNAGLSPLSTTNSFDLSQSTAAATIMPSNAVVPAMGSPSSGSDATATTPNAVTTPPMSAFPLIDMNNYLFALQMQQAQAQNMLKMSAAGTQPIPTPFGFAPSWPMNVA